VPKRLSKIQKVELIDNFKMGKSIDALSTLFGCTKLTITRNLKKLIGDEKYKQIINVNKIQTKEFNSQIKDSDVRKTDISKKTFNSSNLNNQNLSDSSLEDIVSEENQFLELLPLDLQIENSPRKDLTSIPLDEINFKETFYMIIDKKTELIIKELKDYPEYDFLSQDELNRKTIQIFKDVKLAKKCCQKDQKVIKVPNPKVFKIASSILKGKGVTRIVTEDKLIAL